MSRGELWWELVVGSSASGPPVLLHPGAGDSADVFPPSFAAEFASAVLFDPRDAGRSFRMPDESAYDLTVLASDVWSVADAARLRRVVLLGYSLGGAVVQRAAIQDPERVAALVLVATLARPPQMQISEEAMELLLSADAEGGEDEPLDLLAFPELYFSDASEHDLRELRARYQHGRGPTRRSNSRHTAAAMSGPIPTDEELGSVTAPVLVIASTDDRVVPHTQAEAIASPFPRATVRRVSGVGHVPVERQWLEIAQLMNSWLADVASEGTPRGI